MSLSTSTSSNSCMSPILFQCDGYYERKNDDDIHEELLSEISTCSVQSNNSQRSASSKRSYDAFTAQRLTFSEWLIYKRETFERKRVILLDEEYSNLLEVLSNKHILKIKPQLKWAGTLISASKLKIIKVETSKGYEDIIIKPKDSNADVLPNGTNYLKVAKFSMIEDIISKAHVDGSHCGVLATYSRIKKDYCFISREIVLEYINRCKICRDTRYIPSKRPKPLMPIISKGTFYHILIDLIDYSNSPAGPELQYKYIIHGIDHFSSFRFAEPAVNKTAIEVFNFIRRLFSIVGYPIILQTDNGGEFRNEMVETYLLQHNVEYRHSKPYTPTTQGKIERANQTLENAMDKLIKASNHKLSWYDVLHDAVYSINTNISQSTNKSPYGLVFLQEPHRKPERIVLDDDLNEVNSRANASIIAADGINNINMHDDSPSRKETAISECDLTSENNDSNTLEDVASNFRKEADQNYTRSIDLMKARYDKSFKIHQYSIGDIVGVVVPDPYVKRRMANKLPAVVIGYQEIEGYIFYLLGYNFKVLKGKFLVSDLVQLNASTYAKYVGITDDIYGDMSIFASWGRESNSSDDYEYISIQEAYENYTTVDNINDNSSINADPIKVNVPAEANAIVSSVDSDDNATLPDPTQRICYICDTSIENNQELLNCMNCKRNMHTGSQCVYGITQYYDDRNKSFYCSVSCFKRWTIYEVEILGEKGKNYRIKLNTGEIIYKSKAKANKLAEYYKIISIYNNKTLQNSSVLAPLSPDVQILDVISPPNNESSTKIPNASSKRKCCVCKLALTEHNWHKCHSCGKEMHGKIVCKKGQLIIDDDGIIYCSAKCKSSAK